MSTATKSLTIREMHNEVIMKGHSLSFPNGSEGKESACNAGDTGDAGSISGGEMATHSSILTWKIPWTEEPVGYSPKRCKESDMTEQLSTAQYTHG